MAPGVSFVEVNQRIEEERRQKFLGSAKIRIASLRPPPGTQNPAKRSNVVPLKRIFRQERGCRQEDIRNHVKASISLEVLNEALGTAGISAARLLEDSLPYVELDIPSRFKLECLQGSNRILAADEVFGGSHKRWVVDLFQDDMSDDLKAFFVEEYEYQRTPSDGEFYYKIRGYQGYHAKENPFFERLWLGRLSALSKSRRHNLDQLLRHDKYKNAFDKLLAIPSLFSSFRLSVTHEVLGMKCEEPNIHYLNYIFFVWAEICNNDPQYMRLVDIETVETIQGTAPGAFKADHDSLLISMNSGQIFGNFPPGERHQIWSRICDLSRNQAIPSLFTFFEDRKFLVNVAGCIRRLIDIEPKEDIASLLESIFDKEEHKMRFPVQVTETAYINVPSNPITNFSLGSHQLWLAAFREFKQLPADVQKSDILAKSRVKALEITIFEFASLASRLGFRSVNIATILSISADRELARRTLLAARKPGPYYYPELENCIERMVELFSTAQPVPIMERPPFSDTNDCLKPPLRYGIPRDEDHERDKSQLFLPRIFQDFETGPTCMTSFFIRRSVYLAYFGRPSFALDMISSEHLEHHFDLRINTILPDNDMDISMEPSDCMIVEEVAETSDLGAIEEHNTQCYELDTTTRIMPAVPSHSSDQRKSKTFTRSKMGTKSKVIPKFRYKSAHRRREKKLSDSNSNPTRHELNRRSKSKWRGKRGNNRYNSRERNTSTFKQLQSQISQSERCNMQEPQYHSIDLDTELPGPRGRPDANEEMLPNCFTDCSAFQTAGNTENEGLGDISLEQLKDTAPCSELLDCTSGIQQTHPKRPLQLQEVESVNQDITGKTQLAEEPTAIQSNKQSLLLEVYESEDDQEACEFENSQNMLYIDKVQNQMVSFGPEQSISQKETENHGNHISTKQEASKMVFMDDSNQSPLLSQSQRVETAHDITVETSLVYNEPISLESQRSMPLTNLQQNQSYHGPPVHEHEDDFQIFSTELHTFHGQEVYNSEVYTQFTPITSQGLLPLKEDDEHRNEINSLLTPIQTQTVEALPAANDPTYEKQDCQPCGPVAARQSPNSANWTVISPQNEFPFSETRQNTSATRNGWTDSEPSSQIHSATLSQKAPEQAVVDPVLETRLESFSPEVAALEMPSPRVVLEISPETQSELLLLDTSSPQIANENPNDISPASIPMETLTTMLPEASIEERGKILPETTPGAIPEFPLLEEQATLLLGTRLEPPAEISLQETQTECPTEVPIKATLSEVEPNPFYITRPIISLDNLPSEVPQEDDQSFQECNEIYHTGITLRTQSQCQKRHRSDGELPCEDEVPAKRIRTEDKYPSKRAIEKLIPDANLDQPSRKRKDMRPNFEKKTDIEGKANRKIAKSKAQKKRINQESARISQEKMFSELSKTDMDMFEALEDIVKSTI